MAYVCDQPTDTGCAAWVELSDPAAQADLGLSAASLSEISVITAGGLLGVMAIAVGIGAIVGFIQRATNEL